MFSRLISSRLTRAGSLPRALLLCMSMVDELVAGLPIVALPLLRDRLGLNYAQIGLLFTAGALSGMMFEPLINLFSDRRAKKPWILWGLLTLVVAFGVIGNTTSYWLLMLAFVVTMTRWTLLSGIGDFLSPLVGPRLSRYTWAGQHCVGWQWRAG